MCSWFTDHRRIHALTNRSGALLVNNGTVIIEVDNVLKAQSAIHRCSTAAAAAAKIVGATTLLAHAEGMNTIECIATRSSLDQEPLGLPFT